MNGEGFAFFRWHALHFGEQWTCDSADTFCQGRWANMQERAPTESETVVIGALQVET